MTTQARIHVTLNLFVMFKIQKKFFANISEGKAEQSIYEEKYSEWRLFQTIYQSKNKKSDKIYNLPTKNSFRTIWIWINK